MAVFDDFGTPIAQSTIEAVLSVEFLLFALSGYDKMICDNPCMLITDDDRDLRCTLGEVFERKGFRTLLAEDGSEAVKIVEQEKIHLVLLDMHMPRLDGLDALRLVKAHRAMLPCILLSAAWNEELKTQAIKADAYSLLNKPVTCDVITDVVAQAMWDTYHWK